MTKYLFWGGEFHPDTLFPNRLRFVLWVAAFVVGNLALPALVHAVPMGGPRFLPIYFFTLIAAYRYGLWAGLATAVLSPVANCLLTGMPPWPILDVILVKSTTLAVIAALVAGTSRQVSLTSLVAVVVGYQVVGGLYEAFRAGSLQAALGDWIIGWPGLLIQVFAGGAILGVWGYRHARQAAR